jgi:tRNA A64-2'-O-ribosylphosphate transferase
MREAKPNAYLYLSIPEGKKGQNELFQSIPEALKFVLGFLSRGKTVLIHCMQGNTRSCLPYDLSTHSNNVLTGKDRSVGITLSILLKYFDQEGHFAPENPQDSITKTTVTDKLLFIQSFRPEARPSRATLKKVNLFFMGC